MRIVISNTSGVPIYEQIKQQVIAAIQTGDLPAGAPLPSLRALARDLRVSVITTTRAYNDLARDGFITNVHGKGSFVLPRSPELVREQLLREVEESLTAALRHARRAGLTRDEVIEILDQLLRLPEEGQ
ncbi:GntR family transcriptional regulator [Nonomuraea candida]|uniref:GntR family transcriptional regulator n=1 Tax=Nonomuraea candida TaxID=359159 RepID=UPI0005BE3A90|nr:GntR family transcriptional regulator [Nonomuraea candida]